MANDLAIVEENLAPLAPIFGAVLPAGLTPERFHHVAVQAVRNATPYVRNLILGGGMQSFVNACITAAVLGLETDGVTGQGAFVPFKGKVQFLPMAGGYITLGGRGGYTLEGVLVRERDEFEIRPAEHVPIHHVITRPRLRDRGELIGVYGLAKHAAMPTTAVWLDIEEVERIKHRSEGYKRKPDESPWSSHYEAMVTKTGLRAKGKRLPLVTTQMAAALDTQHDLGRSAWITPERTVVVEGTATEVADAAGEELGREVGQVVEYTLQPGKGGPRTYQNPDLWAGQAVQWIGRMSAKQLDAFLDLNGDHIEAARSLGAVAQADRVAEAVSKRRQSTSKHEGTDAQPS